ncbi:MAG: TraR/DksA C4-type zinc finger protein, partial [Bacteroidota bacterium]
PAKPAAPAKKAEVAAPAPVVKAAKAAKGKKAPPRQVITTRLGKPGVPIKGAPNSSSVNKPASKPATVAPARMIKEEKKPTIIIAHRRLENKSKGGSDNGRTMINYQPDFTRSILDETSQDSGPVYRYSDEELMEFRELINSRLEAARKELVYLQGLITRKDEAGTEDTENRYMNMEDGSGAMEREQLAQLASRQIQFINHLEKAMMRIENKTYGICRVTGKLIDKARLRAVPHATLSIEAKKMMATKQQ